MSSASAQASSSGPSTSHRKTGTPASRNMLSRLGSVHTRSVRAWSSANVDACNSCGSRCALSLSVGVRRSPSGGLVVVGGVPDLADQLLDHVLERRDAEHRPVGLHHPR